MQSVNNNLYFVQIWTRVLVMEKKQFESSSEPGEDLVQY